MAKPDLGELKHQCGTVATVRKDKNGLLYLACPNCGLLRFSLAGGQAWILDNATMFGPEGMPEPIAPPKPAPKPAPAIAAKPAIAPAPPPPAAPKRPFFSTLLDT